MDTGAECNLQPVDVHVCYCSVSCAAVFSFKHVQRWPFTNRDHEGHRVQTSVHFSSLGFHGFLSLYGRFSCVLPRLTCAMFLQNCEFSHSTSWSRIYSFCQMFKDDCVSCQRTSGIKVEIHAKLFMFSVFLRSHLHCIWS